MKVLLTNDDGIDAKGLFLLEKFCREKLCFIEEIMVVAPQKDKSGTGHALTINKDIAFRKINDNKYAIDGTPVDCVIIALNEILDYKPDLIIVGINIGANIGIDNLYSGTLAAAIEGMISKVPAIAISQFYRNKESIDFKTESKELLSIMRYLVNNITLLKDTVLSINLPHDKVIKGIKFVPQGYSKTKNITNHSNNSFRITPYQYDIKGHPVDQGFVTITPIGSDLTDYKMVDYLQKSKIQVSY